MDFDDLDEVAPVEENKQPATGTILNWVPRTQKLPGLTNSLGKFSDKVLRELDPPVRANLQERGERNRPTTAKLRLLCIHGVADSYEQSWFIWEAESPPEIEVVVHEFPGHGRRDGETVADNIKELTEDAFGAFKEAMETGSFAILGHSIGCLVAINLAKRAQEELNVKPVAVFMVERGAAQFPLFTEKGIECLRDFRFSVTLDAKAAEDTSLEVKEVDLDGAGGKEVVLMVNSVSIGLLDSWNKANADTPVKFKDEIVCVNGVSGKPSVLRTEVGKAVEAKEDVKLELLRRPHEFLSLYQPLVGLMCKSGPNRTLLRWQRSWFCENDTLEVGFYRFPCPLLAFSAEESVNAYVDLKDVPPEAKGILDMGGKVFNTEVGGGKVFLGHFPRDTYDEWKSWTEYTDNFKAFECAGANHMTIKDHKVLKRTVFDTLAEQIKLW